MTTKWAGKGRNRRPVAWKADRSATRVPMFVIERTGLKTKKKVVAKYGHGASFRLVGKRVEIKKGVRL